MYYIFGPVMLIAIFLVASNYALGISKTAKEKVQIDFKWICASVLLISGVLALVGFSKLLGIIYPIFGLLATSLAFIVIINKIIQKINQKRVIEAKA
jgi:uncharacterized membrane protein YkvI